MKKALFSLAAFTLVLSGPALAQRVSDAPAALTGALDKAPSSNSAFNSVASAPQKRIMAQGIVAIVNDTIISSSDLKARLALAILSAGMPDSPDAQQRLMPQVLRTLIDEQLQLQEGKRMGITISPEEINKAMSMIAEENHIPGGDMPSFLKSHGIPASTLQTQIKATLTWNRVIAREVRPRIDIGDDEIEAFIQRMRANAGKQEYLVSEIFLAADKPEEEEQVKALADKLVEQIRGGVVFGAAARQFSQGLGAGNGGDIGWIQTGQLAPEIDRVLPTLNKGDVAGPIRSTSGYHILGIREKRTISLGDPKKTAVKLEQIFKPFSETTDKDALLREAGTIRQNIQDCNTLHQTLGRDYPTWKWQDLGEVKMDSAPSWLVDKVSGIPDGQGSEPMATDKGALIVFVCSRTMDESINREALRNMIGTEKMELLARRQLRDLRKSAYIDVRLK